MRPVHITLMALLLGSATMHLTAQAGDCRVTSKVVDSAASVTANTTAGGHVAMHVKGKPTEVGKSQFNTEADFTAAFKAWKTAKAGESGNPAAKVCGGSAATSMDCVPAKTVGITSAVVCTAVTAGACTTTSAIVPIKVAFRYAKSGTGSNGVWILNTAYPSMNADCS